MRGASTMAINLDNVREVDPADNLPTDIPASFVEDEPAADGPGINLDDATIVDPQSILPDDAKGKILPNVQLAPITQAGVSLAQIVLAMLTGAIAFFLLFLAVQEIYIYPARIASSYEALEATLKTAPVLASPAQVAEYEKSLTATKALLETAFQQQKDTRAFYIQIAQLILLNLLLPILTALLGYVFGSRQDNGRG